MREPSGDDGGDDEDGASGLPPLPAGTRNYITPAGYRRLRHATLDAEEKRAQNESGERFDDSQNAGPGKYASSATEGLKTMCGTRPSAHWARNSDRSSCWAFGSSYHERPSAMNAESQLHWCG